MKALCLSVLTLFICLLTATGQDKFSPGYYIVAKGDTIRGLIRSRLDYSDQFEFRDSLRMKSIQISISQVSNFAFFSGSHFRAMSFSQQDSLRPVFGKLLLDGSINLFKKEGRFYADGGGRNKFLFLKDRKSKIEEAQDAYKKNAGFFNVLMEACPSILKSAPKTKISEDGLNRLFEEYHRCIGKSFTNYNPRIDRVFNIGGYIGFTSTSL